MTDHADDYDGVVDVEWAERSLEVRAHEAGDERVSAEVDDEEAGEQRAGEARLLPRQPRPHLRCHGTRYVQHTRGWYAYGARSVARQLPCAAGTYATQATSTRSPYVQYCTSEPARTGTAPRSQYCTDRGSEAYVSA